MRFIRNQNDVVKETFKPILPQHDFLRFPDTPLKEQVTPFSNRMKSAVGNILFDIKNPNIYKSAIGLSLLNNATKKNKE